MRAPRRCSVLFSVALFGAVTVAPLHVYAQAAPTPSLALDTRAQELYRQGRDLFFANDFEQARAAFQASLDTVDSPNTRMYLGRALLRLSRNVEAWTTLDRAARDADARALTEPRYAPTSIAARAEADAVAPLIAWLTIEVPDAPAGMTLAVNDLPLQRAALGVAMPMNPGAVVIDARAEGFRGARREVQLTAGGRESVTIALEALPRPPTPPPVAVAVTPRPMLTESLVTVPRAPALRTAGIVTLIAGGATLAAGATFGVLAWDQYSQAQQQQESLNGVRDAELLTAGARNRDTANVLFAAGGTVAAAGLVMFLLGLRTRTERVTTVVMVAPSGVALGGGF